MKNKINFDMPDIPPVPTVKIPAWATSSYDGDVTDMIRDIYSALFWDEVAKLKIDNGGESMSKPEDVSVFDWYTMVMDTYPMAVKEINARLIANGYSNSMVNADKLKSKSERAFMYYLYQMKVDNRYMLTGEFTSFEQFLIEKLPYLYDKPGERGNILFLLEEMLPLLKEIDENLVSQFTVLEDYYSRTREAVPAMKDAVRNVNMAVAAHKKTVENKRKEIEKLNRKLPKANNEEKKKLEETIGKINHEIKTIESDMELIEDVAKDKFVEDVSTIISTITDPNVPVHGVNGVSALLKRNRKVIRIKGHMSMMPNKTVFVFAVPSQYTDTIQNNIDFVDFSNTDPLKLEGILKDIIKKNVKG